MAAFDVGLSGSFSLDQYRIKTEIKAEAVNLVMDGISYMNNIKLKYTASILADMAQESYTVGDNLLELNELKIRFDGSFRQIAEGLDLKLTFSTIDNDFKDILSWIPAVYAKDFEDIDARGKLDLKGYIDGTYTDTQLPAFQLNLSVDNGYFAYKGLPGAARDIQLISMISNPGGAADNTIIDVSQFSLLLEEHPFSASLVIKTPVSDPDIDAAIKGKIDLSAVKNFYPLDEQLSGVIIPDITLKGKLSALENEDYQKFEAQGTLLIENLSYQSESLKQPVMIPEAVMRFSPAYVSLDAFKMQVGKSDLAAAGKITNYLDYVLKDGVLDGNLKITSSYMNLDELFSEDVPGSSAENNGQDTNTGSDTASSVILIPGNINFSFTTSFDELIYDGIHMTKVNGSAGIKDQTLTIRSLQMNAVNGKMSVRGDYSTKDPEKPGVNLVFDLEELDIPATYNTFAVMRRYLPLAKKTTGSMSASLTLNTLLDRQMMPVYESMNGRGEIRTSAIEINDLNTLLEIAEALNLNSIKKLKLEQMKASVLFVDGKMMVKPFDMKFKNSSATVEGWTSFDQSIGYVMQFKIPRTEFGSQANQLIEGWLAEVNKLGTNFSLPENITFDVLIGGTLSKPTVKTTLAEVGNDLVKTAMDEIVKEISQEAREKAQALLDEAEKQAKAIIAEAEKQAKYLRENTDEAIRKLNAEFDKQSTALMAEAKKQGFLAEMAAKEAVKKLKKETDEQVAKLKADSDKEIDKLLDTAKKKAADIKKEAQAQADALLTP